MTDKQIIIDGVDVSGCEFLTKTRHCKAHISIMGTDTNKCKCFSNCYYKQLKRKEQECEKLKEELEAVYDDCKGCPTCNEALYNANLYAKEYRKLKQTLADIKNFLEFEFFGKNIWAKEIILQRISECEVKND